MGTERRGFASATRVFEYRDVYSAWDEDYYHPAALRLFDSAIARMLKLLDARPGDHILDAGCGPGVHSIRAARLGFRVHAVDVSEQALSEARRRAERAGVDDAITFEQQDLTRLELADRSFERIFAWGVLTHIPEIEKALGELARILRPGGHLALEVTNVRAWDHKLERVARRVLRKPGGESERLHFGTLRWHATQGEKLWVWHADTDAITHHMAALGLRRTQRVAVSFTNLQRRLGGLPRRWLLQANNTWFTWGLPPGPAATNLLVFEKAVDASTL